MWGFGVLNPKTPNLWWIKIQLIRSLMKGIVGSWSSIFSMSSSSAARSSSIYSSNSACSSSGSMSSATSALNSGSESMPSSFYSSLSGNWSNISCSELKISSSAVLSGSMFSTTNWISVSSSSSSERPTVSQRNDYMLGWAASVGRSPSTSPAKSYARTGRWPRSFENSTLSWCPTWWSPWIQPSTSTISTRATCASIETRRRSQIETCNSSAGWLLTLLSQLVRILVCGVGDLILQGSELVLDVALKVLILLNCIIFPSGCGHVEQSADYETVPLSNS